MLTIETVAPLCAEQHYALRFAATQAGGLEYVFPCDEGGHVDLNALTEHDKVEYLFARALVGRDLARPVVVLLPEMAAPPT
ncbi:hypothetical protein [Aquabacterium sp.]|uniref:hypothetical protein n=1 Tax=Aquabacterium sp. TaxID=1872578 RepID=UPI0037840A85